MQGIRFIAMTLCLLAALPANAARSVDVEQSALNQTCELSEYQKAVRDMKWNELSMRHFMVTMNAPNDAELIRQVHRDVADGIAKLRREFGVDCVLDIQ